MVQIHLQLCRQLDPGTSSCVRLSMEKKINDFVIQVATVNGSGSQSANNILVKTLFRMGIPVTGKNLFPSNISGLPTWFTIRANPQGFTARKEESDIVVAMNPTTIFEDLQSVVPGGFFLYNDEIKFTSSSLSRNDVQLIPLPFKSIADSLSDSGKLKKLLTNMIYVGVLAQWLQMDEVILYQVLQDLFSDKPNVIEMNTNAVKAGIKWAQENPQTLSEHYQAQTISQGNKDKILIDGNTASAMGWLFGGCTVVSWYPITPSSSLVENFHELVKKYRKKGTHVQAAVIQAEDELASICMVLGAGWAGARAATATSGPGLSLMAEAAGLAYFGEIPSVIWNVQRGGPSTGLPTRTQQGDLSFAYRLSHGDTQHVILLPANPTECFEWGQTCFDLAERLQTLVIVLSDLDLGMNLWVIDELPYPVRPFDRGKVLTTADLEKIEEFARYRDTDGDHIPWRTLPGTDHPKAAYFTRGTGHNEKAQYSEDPQVYARLLDRLKKSMILPKNTYPNPLLIHTTKPKLV